MAALSTANLFNVQASVNAWVAAYVNGLSLPAFLPNLPVVMTMPDEGLTPPCLSLFHLPVTQTRQFQGDWVGQGVKGVKAVGLLDCSGWVTKTNPNWLAQLRFIEAALAGLAVSVGVIGVYDYSNPTTPVATPYNITITDLQGQSVLQDENPDIMRTRYLLHYWWLNRSA